VATVPLRVGCKRQRRCLPLLGAWETFSSVSSANMALGHEENRLAVALEQPLGEWLAEKVYAVREESSNHDHRIRLPQDQRPARRQ
jgi:hypothetical protein